MRASKTATQQSIHPALLPPSRRPPAIPSLARHRLFSTLLREGEREGRAVGGVNLLTSSTFLPLPPSTEVGPWSAWGLVSSSAAVEMSLLILPPPQRPNMVIMIISHQLRRFAGGQSGCPLLPCSSVCLSQAPHCLVLDGHVAAGRERHEEGGREAEREPGRGNQSEMDERLSEPSFVLGRPFPCRHDRFNRNSTGHAAIAADPTPILSAS